MMMHKISFMNKTGVIGLVALLGVNLFATPVSKAFNLNVNEELIAADLQLREPKKSDFNKNKETNAPVTPSSVSDFAASPFKLASTVAQVPVKSRIRMVVDTSLSAHKSKLGDNFQARVLEDFYLTGDYRKLIIPKNSWIRGKVNFVKKPRLLSRAGKLEVKLDSLVTPQGDYVPLDADLTFLKGIVNKDGLLDPQTGYGDKALEPSKKLLGSSTGKTVSIATAGIPVAGTLLAGSVIALFSQGDEASLTKGQELQIMLTQNTDLAI